MADDEAEHSPAEREAARLSREAPDHLGSPAHLAERALEKIGAAPATAVAQWVAQVDDERLAVVGGAGGRGRDCWVVTLASRQAPVGRTPGVRATSSEGLLWVLGGAWAARWSSNPRWRNSYASDQTRSPSPTCASRNAARTRRLWNRGRGSAATSTTEPHPAAPSHPRRAHDRPWHPPPGHGRGAHLAA